MRARLALLMSCLTALPAVAADPPPVRLNVKPLLCVLDKNATACTVTFDIRWKSTRAGEYRRPAAVYESKGSSSWASARESAYRLLRYEL